MAEINANRLGQNDPNPQASKDATWQKRVKTGKSAGQSARQSPIQGSAIAVAENSQSLVYVRYWDHVLYHRGDPLSFKPQVREAVGWLVYEAPEYIIVTWDRDAEPPTLKGGDPKASGLVLLRSAVLELKRLA